MFWFLAVYETIKKCTKEGAESEEENEGYKFTELKGRCGEVIYSG